MKGAVEAEAAISLPARSRSWFIQAILTAIVFMPAWKWYGLWPGVALALLFNLPLVLGPSRITIYPQARRLVFSYPGFGSFRRQKTVDLAGFSRVYSQIDSYAARSLHLSGPQGEHLKLASFAQSVRSANRHIEEVAELRKRIASALHIVDGGEA